MTARVFADRRHAGRELGAALTSLRGQDVVVVGLPRGGVPVAAEVARALAAPLDVIVVRKLGLPHQPEVAMGAIGEDRVRVLDLGLINAFRIVGNRIAEVEQREFEVLQRRVERLRRSHPPLDLHGSTVIVVDDGLATGATAAAACQVARMRGAARIVLAIPVGASDSIRRFRDADEIVSLLSPPDFEAVGNYYQDFSETSDDEVEALLDAAAGGHG